MSLSIEILADRVDLPDEEIIDVCERIGIDTPQREETELNEENVNTIVQFLRTRDISSNLPSADEIQEMLKSSGPRQRFEGTGKRFNIRNQALPAANARVRHKLDGYIGTTNGTTRLKHLFEDRNNNEEIRVRLDNGKIQIASPAQLELLPGLENQAQVATQLKEEAAFCRTGVRTMYCGDLFRAFGYGRRSAESAIRIEGVLRDYGMQVEPSIQRGPHGFGLSTIDLVRISQSRVEGYLEQHALSATFPLDVVAAGTGPYAEDHFKAILNEKGISTHVIGTPGLDVLILGRRDWEEESLDVHIEARRGTHLRVYSQEMFLVYLETGRDPYTNSERLEKFGHGHPALEYLSEWGFDWPQTTIVPSRSLAGADDGDPGSWPQVGLLKHLGYTVGANGIGCWERQRILRYVFTDSLPNVDSLAYMAKWGMPNSTTRLQKLANTIASLARYAKRKASPPEDAIQDWEDDLAWLKETFYHGRFTFSWPSTYVYG